MAVAYCVSAPTFKHTRPRLNLKTYVRFVTETPNWHQSCTPLYEMPDLRNWAVTPKVITTVLVIVLLVIVRPGYGQEQSDQELAKATQNPLATMISLPFQNNTNFGLGPNDRTQNVLNIQPVVPFGLGDNWNLITRTIAPLITQPDLGATSGSTTGFGDILFRPSCRPHGPER